MVSQYWLLWFLSLALFCLGLSLPGGSDAQQTCPSGGQGFEAVDYQEFSVTNTMPVSIDLSQFPAAATNLGMAYVSVEAETIRFRFAGIPTQTSGHEVAPGSTTVLCGRRIIESFRAVRTSTGSQNATMRVTLFKVF